MYQMYILEAEDRCEAKRLPLPHKHASQALKGRGRNLRVEPSPGVKHALLMHPLYILEAEDRCEAKRLPLPHKHASQTLKVIVLLCTFVHK